MDGWFAGFLAVDFGVTDRHDVVGGVAVSRAELIDAGFLGGEEAAGDLCSAAGVGGG